MQRGNCFLCSGWKWDNLVGYNSRALCVADNSRESRYIVYVLDFFVHFVARWRSATSFVPYVFVNPASADQCLFSSIGPMSRKPRRYVTTVVVTATGWQEVDFSRIPTVGLSIIQIRYVLTPVLEFPFHATQLLIYIRFGHIMVTSQLVYAFRSTFGGRLFAEPG